MSLLKSLYLSYDGMTDPLGQSQVIPYLKGLSAKGHTITIISFEKADAFKKNEQIIRTLLGEAKIEWHPLTYTKTPPVISTLYDVHQMRKKAIELFKTNSFNLVHCRSYISGIVGLSLKRKFNCKFIFDMRGFWADERVEGKLWNLKNPVYKATYSFFKHKEREMLLNADYIIILTNIAKQIIQSWNITHRNLPFETIPCCADLDLFSREATQQKKKLTRTDLKISDEKFVISYLGALGTWYMLDEMLDFFKILLTLKPDSHFLFVTPEPEKIILSKAVQKNLAPDKITVVRASREEVPGILALSDASIFFITPVFSKQASSPTKQGEIMSMGIPIVCNSNVGDTEQIINDSNAGVVIHDFTNDSYLDAAKKLLSGNFFNKESARAGAEKYFSLKKGIDLYEGVYQKLAKQ